MLFGFGVVSMDSNFTSALLALPAPVCEICRHFITRLRLSLVQQALRQNLLCGLAHRRISPGNVNIHGLRASQIRRTKQHSDREFRSVSASICRRSADEATRTSAVKVPSRFS